MIIYIDSDFKCHVEAADGMTAVETDAFEGKCKTYIEGFRFVPTGEEWKREDGVVFRGEMVAPWKNYSVLASAQEQYEELIAEMDDMAEALAVLGVTE